MSNTNNSTSPTTQRRITLGFGIFLIAFSIYLLAFLVPDVLRTASGAESMDLVRASEIATSESSYVTIEKARWDCDTIVYIRGRSSSGTGGTGAIITRYTEIFFTDEASDEKVIVLAQMSERMDCADFDGFTPTGYLTTMSLDKQQDLTNDARLARFFDANTFLELCGYCGQENSMIGAVVGAVLLIIGVILTIFGYRMPKGEKVKSDDES